MPRLGLAFAAILASLVLAPQAAASLFTNTAPIEVPGCALMDCTTQGEGNPYPSAIDVEGLPPTLTKIRVTLRGISHTEPGDIDALLVGPSGRKELFMSDSCAGSPLDAVSLMFEDGAPVLPQTGPCAPAVYGSTNYTGSDIFPAPAPGPPYLSALRQFAGEPSNGTWRLFINDDSSAGGVGTIGGGWRLEVLPAVTCAGHAATEYANVGSSGNDVITGTPGPDVLFGLGGDDTINGLGGKDVICGGDGNDLLLGGPGKDLLRGEGGRDKLKGQGGRDTCVGGSLPDKAKACEKTKSI